MTNASPQAIAQTNLQLYTQLMAAGFSAADLQQVHAAYSFAAKQCAPLFRGSGKPFSCHLVRIAFPCFIAGYNAAKPAPEPDALTPSEFRAVKMILLADSIEDALDAGLSLHGKAEDDASVRGSARWRLQRMQAERADFLAAAGRHGFEHFATRFDQLLRLNSDRLSQSAASDNDFGPFTQQYSSFRID